MTKEQKAVAASEAIAAASGGGNGYYRHFFGMTYTGGVHALAQAAGAFWLIDVVASYQPEKKVRRCGFQVWTLKVDLAAGFGVVEMREDSSGPVIVRQEIPATDFPLAEATLWVEEGVLLLPCEH